MSTWDGRGHRQTPEVEGDDHGLALDMIKINARCVRHSRRALAVHAGFFNLGKNSPLHAIAQFRRAFIAFDLKDRLQSRWRVRCSTGTFGKEG